MFFRIILAVQVLLFGNGLIWAGEKTQQFDVVVFGATPAGVCAAVAASREGASVCLVEPLDIVGAIMSSGLSLSDSDQMARESLRGLFEEVHLAIEKKYHDRGIELPYRVKDLDQKRWTYEPHVAESVFKELLDSAKVKVLLKHDVQAVVKDGVRIKEIATTGGSTIAGRVFIDASYEGDLLAAAKVESRVGREGPGEYQESLAGHQFLIDASKVSPWSAEKKLLPLMTGLSLGDPKAGDGKIMTYSFRLCLTDNPERRIPFTRPKNYDASRFELFKRYYAQNPKAPFPIDLYVLPGGKVDANNGLSKQLSLGLVGASWEWPNANAKRRQEIWDDHRSYTEGLFWFLANEPGLPEGVQATARKYGLSKDEFQRFGHWPPVLYVREGRRMVGSYVLTQADILTNKTKPDPVAVGSFPIDSHVCQRVPTDDGGFINEGAIYVGRTKPRGIGPPHQIPYRSLVPKAGQCDNLLVPVCLSATHVAFSSVRVEPTWMVLGQSSGVAAALTVRENVAVQNLPYDKLKTRLEANGPALTLPK